MTEPARPLIQRKHDAIHRLDHDKDLWLASASPSGDPCLVPLSFWWDGSEIFVATVKSNPSARNMVQTGKARVTLGHTRDVVLIDVVASMLEPHELDPKYGDDWATKNGWDPRKEAPYRFFRLKPQHIESWRELNEHSDRTLMQAGKWLV